jgi:hypothetical protein
MNVEVSNILYHSNIFNSFSCVIKYVIMVGVYI